MTPYIFIGISRYQQNAFLHEKNIIHVDLDTIETLVNAEFLCDISSIHRTKQHATGRIAYYYLARKFTNCTLKVIAQRIGRSDHSTVISGINTAEDLIFSDRNFKMNTENVSVVLKKYRNEGEPCHVIKPN